MKSDGSVIIDTKINADGMNKGFAEIKSGVKSVADDAQKATSAVNASFSKMNFSKPVEIAKAKVESLEQRLAAITAEYKIAKASDDDRSAARLGAKRTTIYDQLAAARRKLEIEVTAAANRQAAAEDKAHKKAADAAARESKRTQKEMAKKFSKLTKSAESFGKRFSRILSGAFIFNALSSGLRKLTEYLGKALQTNQEFNDSFSSLKGSLLTALQAIYEALLPAILVFMNIAKKLADVVANIFAKMTGKSTAQLAKNAEALYNQANATEKLGKEAKKAAKSLAGFDEIQKLSEPSADTAAENTQAATPSFSDLLTEETQTQIDKLTTYVSMALLALGAILAFSGVNIPLGIAMMALGAAGLYSQISTNWSGVQEAISGEAGAIAAILFGALLALGAILALSGAYIPLGIGLMAAGAVGLGLTAAANWDKIPAEVKSVIASVMSILSGASVVMGILLCFSGMGLAIGLPLIYAGIKGTKAAWSISSNPITNFVKNMVNAILGMINLMIDGINKLVDIKFPGLNVAGVQVIPKFETKLFNVPKIPLLAEGAVIPPNAPFAAILGDQRHGTNIEAPLSTIQEAVALVMEDYAASNIAGHEATVSVLQDILEAVLGIHIGDDVIGQAVARYNAKMAIIKGGAV